MFRDTENKSLCSWIIYKFSIYFTYNMATLGRFTYLINIRKNETKAMKVIQINKIYVLMYKISVK